MTTYARSDVASVTVGRSHGGCGETHRRPVTNGNPARSWGLVCSLCEAHLTHDPLWSGSLAEVPDTPDEVSARDNVQRHTARSRDDLVALALAKIAGLPVAEFLGEMVGQAADQGTVYCSAGHENFPTAKFCSECGGSLKRDAPGALADALMEASRTGKAVTTTHGIALPPESRLTDDAGVVDGTIVTDAPVKRGPGRPRKTADAG
jgi:hypothetical protein